MPSLNDESGCHQNVSSMKERIFALVKEVSPSIRTVVAHSRYFKNISKCRKVQQSAGNICLPWALEKGLSVNS